MSGRNRFDIVIVGSGLGGSAAARVLVEGGLSVLVVERGDYVRQEKANWDVGEVSLRRRYDSGETWFDAETRPFTPRTYYNVGGATKFFGGAALRFRARDFESRALEDGPSVAWPYGYDELSPWYDRAEALLEVHGQLGEDPTEPPRGPYPFPPLVHEERIAELAARFASQGLHPFHLPLAVDQGGKGRCVKGSPCDGFPCMVRAKGDAENRILRPLLLRKPPNLELWTGSRALRFETDAGGTRVEALVLEREGKIEKVAADHFIVAAGAVNSALLLLASAKGRHSRGLANSSDLVGRNFMCHENTVIMALSPFRKNPTVFQKTLAVHDFYGGGAGTGAGQALGAIQMRGKVRPEMLMAKRSRLLRGLSGAIAARSLDFWLMTEDLAEAGNRVWLDESGRVRLARRPTNARTREALISRTTNMLRRAGLPILFVERRGIETLQHQCGTLRFGRDPGTSVLDPFCKAHDLDNLYAIDASFMPSSAAVNPSLTLLAQSLRAAAHLRAALGAGAAFPGTADRQRT
ncbi:MAG TPA: GMC family oxidoreductase [Rectinemataceae bacterium]|nr:GMC family oxidoreductase [Rectinemataceae bacterium]